MTTSTNEPIGKFESSRKLAIATWRTCKSNLTLVGIMTLSVFVSAIAMIVGFYFVYQTGYFANFFDGTWQETLPGYLVFAVTLLVIALTTTFFKGAIVYGVISYFSGNKASFTQMIAEAFKRGPALLVFALFNYTIGLALNAIESRLPMGSRVVTFLIGVAWSIANIFAVQTIMTTSYTNPIKVTKTSALLFKNVWAQSAFIGIGLGLIATLFTITALALILSAFLAGLIFNLPIIGAILLGLFVVLVIGYSVVITTLGTIAVTAAHYYAVNDRIPEGFDRELVRSMFRPKKRWLS